MSSPDEHEPTGDAPFLPPSRPAAPAPTLPAAAPPSPPSPPPADVPILPSAAPTASPAPTSPEPQFDAKALVESQKHVNTNPAYGTLPKGTDEGREAARKLREQANRKKRRGKVMGRIVLLVVLAGAAVGGYFAYQAINDEVDEDGVTSGADTDEAAADGEGGALTPLGEQEQVIDVLDDLNSGATPSAGGLLDAVDEAREVVGQAEPPVADGEGLLVADVFTPAVLDQTDVLDAADGYERFVVRSSSLAEINPSANDALLALLAGLPQVPSDDAALAVAPVVLPGDVGIAIQREGDRVTRIVAVAAQPPLAVVGP